MSIIPQHRVQVIQMYPYIPLWKRGARGDFLGIILKSPFIPLCQRGVKTPETEGLHNEHIEFILLFDDHFSMLILYRSSKRALLSLPERF